MSSEKYEQHKHERKTIRENRATFKAGTTIHLNDGSRLNPIFRYQNGTNKVFIPEIKNIVESDENTFGVFKTRRYAQWLLKQDRLSVKNLGLVTEAIIEEVSSPFITSAKERFAEGTKKLTKNLISECVNEFKPEKAIKKYAIAHASLKSLSDRHFAFEDVAYNNGLSIFSNYHENWTMDNSILGYNLLPLVRIENIIRNTGSLPDDDFFNAEVEQMKPSRYFEIFGKTIIDILANTDFGSDHH